MVKHKVAAREEWLAARNQLLAKEKELTRRGDQLAAERRNLPWVPIEKEFRFDTDEGPKTVTRQPLRLGRRATHPQLAQRLLGRADRHRRVRALVRVDTDHHCRHQPLLRHPPWKDRGGHA